MRICKKGNIDGHFTNHSLRATTASRGIEKGIPDKFVMERTGHRDVRSLQKYQRPSLSTKIGISRAFEINACLSNDCDNKALTQKGQSNISGSGKVAVKRPENECVEEQDRPKEKISKVSTEGQKVAAIFNNCTFSINRDFTM